MVLGDVSRTRRLCGNPSTTNVSDADITQGLTYGTSRAAGITGKIDWETSTTHKDYATVVMAAEYYASSMVRDRFQDQTNISTEHFDRAEALLTQVANSLAASGEGGGAGGGAGTATRTYRSYPLNSSATVYQSMFRGGQQLVGVASVYEVPSGVL